MCGGQTGLRGRWSGSRQPPPHNCTTGSEPPAPHQVPPKAPRGQESLGNGVWCLMRAGRMHGCCCWVSGLEPQTPALSGPKPRNRSLIQGLEPGGGYDEGREGRGWGIYPVSSLMSPPASAPFYRLAPLPSCWPPRQGLTSAPAPQASQLPPRSLPSLPPPHQDPGSLLWASRGPASRHLSALK